MNKTMVTGDIHGNPIARLSFKQNPIMREMTDRSDVVIILGDFGLPFGINSPRFGTWKNEIKHNLEWLNNQKYTTLALCGNHDDRDAIAKMEYVERFNGFVRQMEFDGQIYENIYIVDVPQVLTVNGKTILAIPGAVSHDIKHGILEPDDPHFKRTYKEWSKNPFKMFRVNHWNWWENEGVNIEATRDLLNNFGPMHFDWIISHQAPRSFVYTMYTDHPSDAEYDEEEFLEELFNTLDFDFWMCGHYHVTTKMRNRNLMCVFEDIFEDYEIDRLVQEDKQMERCDWYD